MERERQRRLHVEGRLADLEAKFGPAETEVLPAGHDLPSTWGAPGSLARQMMPPGEYEHVLALHENMLTLDRQRRGVDQPAVGPNSATVRELPIPAVESSPVAKPQQLERPVINVDALEV